MTWGDVTEGAPRRHGRRDLPRSALVAGAALLLSACPAPGDPVPPPPPDTSLASSCAKPLIIPFHAAADGRALTRAERHDLVMSATARIPSDEGEVVCEGGSDVERYTLAPPDGGAAETAFVRFSRADGPAPARTVDSSRIAATARHLVRDGRCAQAWEYLTPLVAAGSSEAAGVLRGATYKLFSTDRPGADNAIDAPRMSATGPGFTGRDFERALMVASLPSGPNDIFLGLEETRPDGAYLNRQLSDFVSRTGCDFRSPTFNCRILAIQDDAVEPIETYGDYLVGGGPDRSITCNRRP